MVPCIRSALSKTTPSHQQGNSTCSLSLSLSLSLIISFPLCLSRGSVFWNQCGGVYLYAVSFVDIQPSLFSYTKHHAWFLLLCDGDCSHNSTGSYTVSYTHPSISLSLSILSSTFLQMVAIERIIQLFTIFSDKRQRIYQ